MGEKNKKLEIGDRVRLEEDEEVFIAKYVWEDGRFLDSINEMHKFDSETCEIIEKNEELKNIDEFTTLEKHMLMFFEGGENKKKMITVFEKDDYNEVELKYVFKNLVKDGYILELFNNKYLSKILKNKLVVKVK